MTIRIVLADDQPLVRSGFRLILEAEEDVRVVGEASDGEEAVAATQRLQPDIVLMDVQMPNVDVLEATRRIAHSAQVGSRVLILTTFERDDYVFEAPPELGARVEWQVDVHAGVVAVAVQSGLETHASIVASRALPMGARLLLRRRPGCGTHSSSTAARHAR